jgi:4-carboxymuconolactone decarboxylase
MSRILPADEKADPLLAEAYAQITRTRGYVADILKVFSHAPEGLQRFAAYGEYVRYRSDLPARTRELAILAIARGNQYAWSHHFPHATKAGVTQSELDALNDGAFADTLSAAEKAAARYAQEFAGSGNVSDATFAELKRHYTDRQITDLTLLAGYFVALGSTISALRVELEPRFKPVMRPIK